jgi:serine protease
MQKISFFLVALALVFSSCKKQETTEQNSIELTGDLVQKANITAVPDGDPLSKNKVDEYVKLMMDTKGDFRWDMVDFNVRWSAIQYGDQSVAIGYQPAGLGDISAIIHKVDVHSGVWKEVHDNIIQLVRDRMRERNSQQNTEEQLIIEDDPTLPVITFRLTDKHILTELYNLENVRYIEPLDYWYGTAAERSTSGCSASTYAINAADISTTTPNCILPWNFNNVNIPAAWANAAGQGITIGVIDGGISSSQTLLGSQFNNGDSNVGRTITTDYTFGNSAYTTCTHGNSMSGLAAGPRNNLGATTGVAYKANLHFIRGCEDVIIDGSAERTGVKNALVKMGDKADVKVVSMSIGTPFYSSVVEDGVNYAYNKGKMLMAAAGTSFSWLSWWGVVYPAALTKCVAITGVKENYATCSSCHDGSQVDFTITMERNNNSSRNALSLPTSGVAPKYIGGSSAATAIAAGIAADVWSVNSNFTREQVYGFLLTTSQNYPTPNSTRGYGNLNAGAAVNAALGAL